jgi:Ion channel.
MRNLTKWLGAVLGVLLLVGLLALPAIEQAYAPDAANIKDVGDTLWYALVTLTTVGYGDYYPVSAPGQVLGALFVLSSLGVLGLLIGKMPTCSRATASAGARAPRHRRDRAHRPLRLE